jgi:hypothetical protein
MDLSERVGLYVTCTIVCVHQSVCVYSSVNSRNGAEKCGGGSVVVVGDGGRVGGSYVVVMMMMMMMMHKLLVT